MDYNNLNNKELYSRCLELSGMIKKYRNQFIALLPEVAARRLYLEHGMHSIYEFAAKLGCLSNKTVDRVLNISAKIEILPSIKEKFVAGEIGWAKLEVIAPVLTIENETEFANKLPTLSIDAARTLVREIKTENFDVEKLQESKEVFSVKMDSDLLAQLRVLKNQLEKEIKQPLSWEQTLGIMVSKLQTPIKTEKIIAKTKESTSSRYIPADTKRQALQKTNQLCAKCKKPAEHLHHQIPYSISNSHESIIPLCKAHHDLIHHSQNNYINRKYQHHKTLEMNMRL